MWRSAVTGMLVSLCACSLVLEGSYEAPATGGVGATATGGSDAGVTATSEGGGAQDGAGAPTPEAGDASIVTKPADTCTGAVHEREPNDSEPLANDVTGVFCGVTDLTDTDYLRLVVADGVHFRVQLEAPQSVYFTLVTASSASSGNGATTTGGIADDNGGILQLWATTATPLAYRVTLTTK